MDLSGLRTCGEVMLVPVTLIHVEFRLRKHIEGLLWCPKGPPEEGYELVFGLLRCSIGPVA